MFIISAHLTKFRFTILAAVALLAVVGALVALPDSAEAGRRALIIKSVDMTITPTAAATRDNKVVDISFTWGAPNRAKGYWIQERHRENVADSPPGEAEWSELAPDRSIKYAKTGDYREDCLSPSPKLARRWNGE